MRIKSNNTFRVNRKKLLENAENIGLVFGIKFERGKSLDKKKVVLEEPSTIFNASRGYGDNESYRFGSNNTLTAVLKEDILNLSLSSYGDICGFEFEEDDLFGKKIKCYGDVYDCMLMMDVLKLLYGCVVEVLNDKN